MLRECAPGERRVALTPDGAGRLIALGYAVTVETGAGDGSWFDDASYLAAGAAIADGPDVVSGSDILLCVQPPDAATRGRSFPAAP